MGLYLLGHPTSVQASSNKYQCEVLGPPHCRGHLPGTPVTSQFVVACWCVMMESNVTHMVHSSDYVHVMIAALLN